MKNFVYISGVLSIWILSISYFMRTVHIPGGALGIFIGTILLNFVFLPTLAIYLYKKDKSLK